MIPPKGTPPEIVAALDEAVGEALKDPKLLARLADIGGIARPKTPAEFRRLVADETEKCRKVVEFAGVSVGVARPENAALPDRRPACKGCRHRCLPLQRQSRRGL